MAGAIWHALCSQMNVGCLQWQKSRCISVVRLVVAVALEIVWRNPEPPARSDPKITRSAPGEYSLEGQTFAIVYRCREQGL